MASRNFLSHALKGARGFRTFLAARTATATAAAPTSERAIADFLVERVAKGVGRSTTIVAERGDGIWIESVDGKRYLDATTGIGVTSTGGRPLAPRPTC